MWQRRCHSPTGLAACSLVPTVRTSSISAAASGCRCVVISRRITSAVFLAHAKEPWICLWRVNRRAAARSHVDIAGPGGVKAALLLLVGRLSTHLRRSCVQYSSTRLLRFILAGGSPYAQARRQVCCC